MAWDLTGDRAIYPQLVEQLQLRIVSGIYPPGGRMETVRELANEASVNPNTMQRALAELERQELVFSQRTSGRYVTEDPERVSALRRELALQKAGRFFSEMRELGFSRDETVSLLDGMQTAPPAAAEPENDNDMEVSKNE